MHFTWRIIDAAVKANILEILLDTAAISVVAWLGERPANIQGPVKAVVDFLELFVDRVAVHHQIACSRHLGVLINAKGIPQRKKREAGNALRLGIKAHHCILNVLALFTAVIEQGTYGRPQCFTPAQ